MTVQSTTATSVNRSNRKDDMFQLEGENFADHEYVPAEGPKETEAQIVEEVPKKSKSNPPSTSDIFLMHRKKIQAFVGPSDLYLAMKGMKLKNWEVTTVKFLGMVPLSDLDRYMARSPNVTKVIMDSYGPISCTWSAFDGVRKSLTSFVVQSGNGYLDVCHFINF